MDDKKLDQLTIYCNLTWPIFPLNWMIDGHCSCGSAGCKSPGKHPLVRGGFLAATTDLSQIITWHKQWPDANWGMRTGDRKLGGSGILVVDIDRKNNGFEAWDMLTLGHPDREDTITVLTGNKGQHRWYLYPAGMNIGSSASKLGVGIDIRANGGYVVIPPSKTSHPYEFELSPEDTSLNKPPEWLVEDLRKVSLPSSASPTIPAALRIGNDIPQGSRHASLLTAAGALRRTGMTTVEITAALKTIRDQRFSDGDHPVTDDEIEDIANWVDTKDRSYALSDLGNAERFIEQHSEDVRYCYEWDKWLVWDGRRWKVGDQASLMRLAHSTVISIYQEATNTLDDKKRAAIASHAIKSQAAHRIDAMCKLIKPYLVVRPDQLDQHLEYLNVTNGVIDLRTGDLLPHDRDHMITKLVEVEYDTNAPYDEWEKFLELVTGGDKDLQLFLGTAVGYTLTGRTDEHALFFLYGVGANGKTTFTETIRRLIGDGSVRVDIESLMQSFSRGQTASPYVAQLAGTRLALASEIPENRKLNESLIKDLTGGDSITARFLFANPFTFTPTHKLWIFGNHKPKILGTDEGIWRRLKIIPFKVTIPPEERRPLHEVLDTFASEMQGILAWAVTGSILWHNHGLKKVDAVEKATSEYRSEQDLVQQFLEERCEMNSKYLVLKDELYKAWRKWCEDTGETDAMRRSKKWLTQQMTRRGFDHGGAGNKCLKGLRLAP